MRTLSALALLMSCALIAACGDNLSVESLVDAAVTDGREIDTPGSTIDANCPARVTGQVGGPCATDAQCDSTLNAGDGLCFHGQTGPTVWPAEGYCVNKVQFGADDGCHTDADCGANNLCATIDDPGGPFRACLPSCGTGECGCTNGQICAGSFSGSALLDGDTACFPGNNAAIDGSACSGFGECAQDSLCLQDPYEYPGGQCHTVACTIGDDSTCGNGDGHCIDYRLITANFSVANVCVDACVTDADCRQNDGYRCYDAGGTVGKFCRHPTAGDPCTTENDCGNPVLWDCSTGLTFPGGSCTPTFGCPVAGEGTGCSPSSSICYDSVIPVSPVDNVCADRCGGPVGTQGGCRTGYTCRDTAPGAAVILGCVAP